MSNELKKHDAIEPEIIDESGCVVGAEPPAGASAPTVFGMAAGAIGGFMALVIFIVMAVIVAVPMLIMRIFGKKTEIKIFKYRR